MMPGISLQNIADHTVASHQRSLEYAHVFMEQNKFFSGIISLGSVIKNFAGIYAVLIQVTQEHVAHNLSVSCVLSFIIMLI